MANNKTSKRGPDVWRGVTGFSKRKPGIGRPAIYPWPNWCDGNIWEVTQGEDFKTSMATFRTGLSNRAKMLHAQAFRKFFRETGANWPNFIKVETSTFDFETGKKLPDGRLQFSFYEVRPNGEATPIKSIDFTHLSEATVRFGNKGSKDVQGNDTNTFCDYVDRKKGFYTHEKGKQPGCPRCDPEQQQASLEPYAEQRFIQPTDSPQIINETSAQQPQNVEVAYERQSQPRSQPLFTPELVAPAVPVNNDPEPEHYPEDCNMPLTQLDELNYQQVHNAWLARQQEKKQKNQRVKVNEPMPPLREMETQTLAQQQMTGNFDTPVIDPNPQYTVPVPQPFIPPVEEPIIPAFPAQQPVLNPEQQAFKAFQDWQAAQAAEEANGSAGGGNE